MSGIKVKVGGYIRDVGSIEELIEMAREGHIVSYDPIYLPSMSRWAHAEEIPELVDALAQGREKVQQRVERAARPWWRKLVDRLTGRR